MKCVRVHELAKEFGTTPDAVLRLLWGRGFFVRAASLRTTNREVEPLFRRHRSLSDLRPSVPPTSTSEIRGVDALVSVACADTVPSERFGAPRRGPAYRAGLGANRPRRADVHKEAQPIGSRCR